MAIEDVYPGQTIPDENNFFPDGTQYKAPDHSILNGKMLLERKSSNAVDNSRFYYKLQEISVSQGLPIFGVGQNNISNMISALPKPAEASQKITDFMLNQMKKTIKKAVKKFEVHSRHIENAMQLRTLIISDNSEIRLATAFVEYFVARMMGGVEGSNDETGLIDAIILVKHPAYVLDEPNSYWFNCLIKKRLTPADQEIVMDVASALLHRIADHPTFFPEVKKVQIGYYQPWVV
jgi:hypothetical protein